MKAADFVGITSWWMPRTVSSWDVLDMRRDQLSSTDSGRFDCYG